MPEVSARGLQSRQRRKIRQTPALFLAHGLMSQNHTQGGLQLNGANGYSQASAINKKGQETQRR